MDTRAAMYPHTIILPAKHLIAELRIQLSISDIIDEYQKEE